MNVYVHTSLRHNYILENVSQCVYANDQKNKHASLRQLAWQHRNDCCTYAVSFRMYGTNDEGV